MADKPGLQPGRQQRPTQPMRRVLDRRFADTFGRRFSLAGDPGRTASAAPELPSGDRRPPRDDLACG